MVNAVSIINMFLFSYSYRVHAPPPNKISLTTMVAFGAITDIWNVSIYIHIMNKKIKKILQHLTFEINHTKWGGGGVMGVSCSNLR